MSNKNEPVFVWDADDWIYESGVSFVSEVVRSLDRAQHAVLAELFEQQDCLWRL